MSNRRAALKKSAALLQASRPMDGPSLARLATALFGRWGWQVAAARFLGVDDRTVRRWATGDRPVATPAAAALRAAWLARSAELAGVKWDVDGSAVLPPCPVCRANGLDKNSC